MIRPYLRGMINNHNAPMRLKVHSGNKVIDRETQFGEWKIQLNILINFSSYIDFTETRITHIWSDNIEVMMGSETNDISLRNTAHLINLKMNLSHLSITLN